MILIWQTEKLPNLIPRQISHPNDDYGCGNGALSKSDDGSNSYHSCQVPGMAEIIICAPYMLLPRQYQKFTPCPG